MASPTRSPMKKTNSRQFERLVELMKENIEIARGFCGVGASKLDVKDKWKEIGIELDALGPPMRLGSEWQKIWIDMKGKVKRILGDNRREIRGTGGGPNKIKQLTPLQQEIDMLLGISVNVNPAGRSFGCDEDSDLSNENIPPITEHDDDANQGTTVEMNQAGPSNARQRRSKRRRTVMEEQSTERSELLREQTDIQKQTLKEIKKIEGNTYNIAKNLKKLVDTQNEQNLIMKDDMKQKAIDNLEKRKLKVRELELKKNELELKKRELDLKEASMV